VRRWIDKAFVAALGIIAALITLVWSGVRLQIAQIEEGAQTQSERVIRCEQHQVDMDSRLERMEGKIDKILERRNP
jgi:hypothetical protein